jgi:hypothetical protein
MTDVGEIDLNLLVALEAPLEFLVAGVLRRDLDRRCTLCGPRHPKEKTYNHSGSNFAGPWITARKASQ